jgi:hypothetical protein
MQNTWKAVIGALLLAILPLSVNAATDITSSVPHYQSGMFTKNSEWNYDTSGGGASLTDSHFQAWTKYYDDPANPYQGSRWKCYFVGDRTDYWPGEDYDQYHLMEWLMVREYVRWVNGLPEGAVQVTHKITPREGDPYYIWNGEWFADGSTWGNYYMAAVNSSMSGQHQWLGEQTYTTAITDGFCLTKHEGTATYKFDFSSYPTSGLLIDMKAYDFMTNDYESVQFKVGVGGASAQFVLFGKNSEMEYPGRVSYGYSPIIWED